MLMSIESAVVWLGTFGRPLHASGQWGFSNYADRAISIATIADTESHIQNRVAGSSHSGSMADTRIHMHTMAGMSCIHNHNSRSTHADTRVDVPCD